MVAGSGTGADAIVITLPNGTAMQMEVSLGCNSASVSIVDAGFVEVVNFSNVPVFGASSFCSSNSPGFGRLRDVAYSGPIGDFR
jgi:proline racemase